MWTRGELKSNALAVLKQSYWLAFLVSIVVLFVGGSGGPPSFNFNWNMGDPGSNIPFEFTPWLIAGMILVGFMAFILFFAFRVFLGYPLEVGSRKYFVESQQYKFDLNHLGYAFNKSRYLDIVVAMLWKGFLTFLWFLLFIIPGFVALYAYRMVPYILGDNPNLGYQRAVKLSSQMTNGHKIDIFLLDLSFLGWFLLGLLALFVGTLFVWPYVNAANGQLYLELRRLALAQGFTTCEELKLEA